MKITKTASGKSKVNLTRKEWQTIGKKAGWMNKVAWGGEGIEEAFQGIGGGFEQAANNKVQEYAQRIMNGEPKEQVLQGHGPVMIESVEKYIAQMSNSAPAQSNQGIQYSLSKSVQWANSTKDPYIIDYVDRINSSAQANPGSSSDALSLIMKAMSGDQNAYAKVLQNAGGTAISI